MRRSEKEVVISDLLEKVKKTKAIILAEYRGLTVAQLTAIRGEVKKVSGDFKVIKNRLAKLSVVGTEWAPLESYFKGPLGMAISDLDPVTLAKIMVKFSETYPVLKLKVGIMGGRVLDVKALDALSKLPSKEELYSKLLGTLQAPASGLVRTLQGVPQKLAIALKAIAEKKQ